MPREDEEDRETQAAEREWKSFERTKPARPKRPVDPAQARKNLEAARTVAAEDLAKNAPKHLPPITNQDDLDEDVPQMALEPVPPVEKPLERCSCGQLLGHATYGVCADGLWKCPSCFMQACDRQKFPHARAVNCPTCHCTTVDFTGMNRCVRCGARGAMALRAS